MADGGVYALEKVVKKQKKKGKTFCLIKWKGWPSKYNSWEPESNLIVPANDDTFQKSTGDDHADYVLDDSAAHDYKDLADYEVSVDESSTDEWKPGTKKQDKNSSSDSDSQCELSEERNGIHIRISDSHISNCVHINNFIQSHIVYTYSI